VQEIGTATSAWAKARSRTTEFVLDLRFARFCPPLENRSEPAGSRPQGFDAAALRRPQDLLMLEKGMRQAEIVRLVGRCHHRDSGGSVSYTGWRAGYADAIGGTADKMYSGRVLLLVTHCGLSAVLNTRVARVPDIEAVTVCAAKKSDCRRDRHDRQLSPRDRFRSHRRHGPRREITVAHRGDQQETRVHHSSAISRARERH
jgi:hypothetical protein